MNQLNSEKPGDTPLDDLLKESGFSPEKSTFLKELVVQAQGKPRGQLLPLLVRADASARASGIHFSDAETALLIQILMPDMTAADEKRLKLMRQISSRIAAGNGQSGSSGK